MSLRRVLSFSLLFVIFQVQLSFGETNESSCPATFPISWLEKPPYTTRPTDVSSQNEFQGLFKDTFVSFVAGVCCDMESTLNQTRVRYEYEMLQHLRTGKSLVVVPVTSMGRESVLYEGFHFMGIVEYPGADFITLAEVKNPGTVVTITVLKSWPLLVVTAIMMAISGICMWALERWNETEFPRSFFRGSWEGFWWSFISMTTVGYGDKAPKSLLGRLFAMVWILTGLVIMAIFMANITSALTSMSLEPASKSINGKEVAVLGNGTEYNIAEEEGAKPIVFQSFDEMVKAVQSKQVGGMLVDRYTGYYYIKEANYTDVPLITSLHIETIATVGLLFAEDTDDLTKCLELVKIPVLKSIQTAISSYKAPRPPMLPETHSIYDTTKGPLKTIPYVTLGILCVLLVLGTIWEFIIGSRSKMRRKSFKRSFTRRKNDRLALFLERTTGESELRKDLEEGKKLLQQLLEYFEKVETRSQEKYYHNESKTKAHV